MYILAAMVEFMSGRFRWEILIREQYVDKQGEAKELSYRMVAGEDCSFYLAVNLACDLFRVHSIIRRGMTPRSDLKLLRIVGKDGNLLKTYSAAVAEIIQSKK